MTPILIGSINATDNVNLVRDISFSDDHSSKVISLNDENIVSLNAPNIIGGTCLLPPIDALIAEQDGDEQLYDAIYTAHIASPFISDFIAAILAALYNKTNILLFTTDLQGNSFRKLAEQFYQRYGIIIGILGSTIQCQYDEMCLPIWLSAIYRINAISSKMMLYLYPTDCAFDQFTMEKLIIDMGVFGNSYVEKESFVVDLCKKIKEKTDIKIPLISSVR